MATLDQLIEQQISKFKTGTAPGRLEISYEVDGSISIATYVRTVLEINGVVTRDKLLTTASRRDYANVDELKSAINAMVSASSDMRKLFTAASSDTSLLVDILVKLIELMKLQDLLEAQQEVYDVLL